MQRYRVVKDGQRFCGNRCATLARMAQGFEPNFIGWKRRTGYRTDIEAMVEAVLQLLAIPYLFEHKVGRYSADFALPTLGVLLECDGWRHGTAAAQAHDATRDAVLTEQGWRVIRLPDAAIRTNAEQAVRDGLDGVWPVHSDNA